MNTMSKTTSNSSYRCQVLTSGSSVITKYVLIAGLVVFALSLTSPCAAQQPASPSNSDSTLVVSPAYKGQTIYVRDFEIDPVAFKRDKGGITGKGFLLPPPPGLARKHQDPAAAARKLSRLMSESLLADLKKAGFTAVRLYAREDRPKEGVVVTGLFTEMNEGNQMRRALVGFGAGAAKMELIVSMTDASQPAQSLYEVLTETTSGKKPGAVITLSPGVAVVKFVTNKTSPEKTVKKAAAKIAEELTKQLKGQTLVAKN